MEMTRKQMLLIRQALDSYHNELLEKRVILNIRSCKDGVLGEEAGKEYEQVKARISEVENLDNMILDLLLREDEPGICLRRQC